MGALDALALAAAAAYLGAVALRGNAGELGRLLANDGGYLKFALAAAILVALYQSKAMHPLGRGLILVAAATLALRVIANPQTQALIQAIRSGQGAWATILGPAQPASPTDTSSMVPASPLALPSLPSLSPGVPNVVP